VEVENPPEVDLEFSSPSSPTPPPSIFIMSSMRNTALLRTLGKSLSSSLSTTSTRPILRQSTCIRPLSSFQSPARHSPPFRPTRFYSTTPPEDIKVYTFKDVFLLSSPKSSNTQIDTVSKSPKDKTIIGTPDNVVTENRRP
jgi:hypothetical protein